MKSKSNLSRALCAGLLLLSCSDNVTRKHIFFRMDTVTEITVSVPRSAASEPLWKSIDSLLRDYENRFSATGEMSEIQALNGRTAQSLAVSLELGEMLKTGYAWGDSLAGAFDITVLPLKEIWGLCEECSGEEPLPDTSQINAALRSVNYKNIRVNDAGDSVFFESADTRIDIGGIAKGFAIRRIAALLRERGFDNFLISAGGDIAASGRKRDNTPWRVGVRHPRNHGEMITVIPMESGALATSGDYVRYRVAGGKRYHHIFNPSTGHSCGRNQSLTIWADDPVTADILSTGLFCLDANDILAYIRARDGAECIIVDADGTVFNTLSAD